ncbi:putative outer membrane starch-binding protein [Chitinophaga niastensis]|uniref:Putative outer membrane starch-binding protein n=1 Tax=Chitinophaga niastensis TaxID=536980 RepID=A0A2P8HES8_CHINA|nr:RagB/SusD family nutrient uptake outer membrane protein [Chitinophaga niastensis]PSL44738.1 putative outer membrane starch-binding protein [Chitinophaga niastensis]
MKRNILYILLFSSLLESACQKDFLNKNPTDAYSNGSLWSSQSDASAALNGCYAGWESDYNIIYLDAVSDNSYSQFYWDNYQHLGNGTANPSDLNTASRWDYTTIQKCNWFLANIDRVTMADKLKAQYKGEARFLRAYQYFIMSQLYGDVPLVIKSLTPAEAATVTRTPAADVRKFVTDELAAIATDLPASYSGSDVGRVTQGAALSLKARMELYDKKYADCIADCKKIMGLGYTLFPSYQDLFRIANKNNSEVILDIQYKANDQPNGDMGIMPSSSFGGWSSLSPTQSLVDAYEMTNGKTINDPASGYSENDPYSNRDPRLSASIVYPGLKYEGKYYNSIEANAPDYYNGNNNSPTGYIEKKFTSNLSDFTDIWNTGMNTIVIRYAEVLLTYAEAQIESGIMDNSVYSALDAIRTRAGMPVVDRNVYNSLDKLRTLVRRERRVELALEGLRWFDVQRWQIGPAVRSGVVYGTRLGTVDAATGKLTLTGEHIKVETRSFNAGRDYLWPIPQKERDLNKSLPQNAGY